MLGLEEFMEIQQLYHDGVSITEIARRLARDRKTVRKYLPADATALSARAEEVED